MFTKKIRTDGEPNEKEFKSWANVQMVMDNAFTQREKIRKVKEDGTISDVKNFCMSRIPCESPEIWHLLGQEVRSLEKMQRANFVQLAYARDPHREFSPLSHG